MRGELSDVSIFSSLYFVNMMDVKGCVNFLILCILYMCCTSIN